VYFVNVNGISYGATGGDFATIGKTANDHGIDILGIAETHLDTTRFPVREVLRKAALQNLDTTHVKLVTASSNRQYNSYRKPGGTLLLTQGHTTGRCQKSFSDDMGRWCSTTYSGQNGRQLTVISAYQVCDSPPVADTSNQTMTTMKTKAVTQQYSMMVEKGLPLDRHPRTQFCLDLSKYITELKTHGHLILLMGDFNEVLSDNPEGMETVAQAGGLQDLLADRIGRTDFSTYIRGSSRIDYILASPEVVTACTAAGYDPYKFRFSGDHRGMYLDLNTITLFGNDTPGLTPPSKRILQARHRKNRLKYLQAKYEYLTGHNWFERLDSFTETSDVTLLESLDRDWVRAAIQAEKKCTRHHPCAFVKRIAELRNQRVAVKIRISELTLGKRMSRSRQGALEKCSSDFTLPTTLVELLSLRQSINTEIKQLEDNEKISRATEQEETRAARLAAGDLAGAKALRNIIIAEETREMWKQIRSMDNEHDQGVTTVQIPADGDLSNPNCKTCETWINLDQPEAIRAALIQRNKLHFGQAQGTFPTIYPFSEKITWEADTPSSEMLLDGNIPFSDDEIDNISKLFLEQFQRTTDLDSISAAITKEEWVGKMKVWNEATTTSPSGLHLGHHKCLIREVDIPQEGSASAKAIEALEKLERHREKMLEAQITLINHAIAQKHVFERWKKVANFMIFKEPGNTKIHRLRVIHLYEADLNFILGVKWRALTHHGIDNHLFSPWQFGGLPGRDALTPVFLEDIQLEISRASNTTLCCTDFDATSCYDRIIPSIASLAGRSFGQNQVLCFVHAKFLAEAKYLLKTKLGISEEVFSHCTPHPIYGNGQGSGNGPTVWGMISTKLLNAHAAKANGAAFMRPDRS
jgi:exonuclease III